MCYLEVTNMEVLVWGRGLTDRTRSQKHKKQRRTFKKFVHVWIRFLYITKITCCSVLCKKPKSKIQRLFVSKMCANNFSWHLSSNEYNFYLLWGV